jgi:hypothetical protein
MHAKDALIARIREVAFRLGTTTLSCSQFTRETGVGIAVVVHHFDSWSAFCAAAGLSSHPRNVKLTDDELFAAMRDAFVTLGGVTNQHRFLKVFPYSRHRFAARGKLWTEILFALRQWCEAKDPAFPYLDQLPTEARPRKGQRPATELAIAAAEGRLPPPKDAGRTMGEFLGFRAMSHAPVNELGVVFLFALVAGELGYSLEMLVPGFPDGQAKRRVRGGRWEPVRIEFEFRASHFQAHNHDPAKCDLIVCWEDDWPGCPVDVLELRKVVREIMEREKARGGATPA